MSKIAQSPELQAKIARWSQAAVEGTLSRADLLEAVAALREGRLSAAAASEVSRRRTAKAIVPSADDLLDEM